MTKKEGGRPIKYHDTYHKKWREDQTAYNHELYAICKEFDCSMKEARVIRRRRLAERDLKALQETRKNRSEKE